MCDGIFRECVVSNDTVVVANDKKHVFLLNDYFLFTKPIGTPREPKFEVEFHLPLLAHEDRHSVLVKFEGLAFFATRSDSSQNL